MVNFKSIIGHQQIIKHLQNALKSKQVSHAYIFNGPNGTGKNLLAKAFAKALQCEAGYGECCDICKSCSQVESGNHPDIKWITHEKPGSIGVDDIREQLNGDISIKPYSSKYKIYIIDEAEKLTVQAQNALLKTIEEPPAYGVIIFLTNDANILLPTISSRCVTLNLRPVARLDIQRYLMDELKVPDYKAKVCAAFAQGSVGKAVKMAGSAQFNEMNEDVLHILKYIDDMEVYEIIDGIRRLGNYKLEITEIIDLMMVWYRDILILKATNDMNQIIYQDEYNFLKKKAGKSSFEGLNQIIQAMEKAKVRLAANVNFELAMEMMLLTIKEN